MSSWPSTVSRVFRVSPPWAPLTMSVRRQFRRFLVRPISPERLRIWSKRVVSTRMVPSLPTLPPPGPPAAGRGARATGAYSSARAGSAVGATSSTGLPSASSVLPVSTWYKPRQSNSPFAGAVAGAAGCRSRRCRRLLAHRRLALQAGIERFQKFGRRRLRRGKAGHFAHHALDFAGGGKNHVKHFGRQGQLVAAKLVEQVFGAMAEFDHRRGVKKTGAALDGVKAAEDRVQQALVLGVVLEFDQLLVDVVKQLPAFGQEVLQQVLHIGKSVHCNPLA